MAKMIAFDQEARDAMRRGVSKLAQAVKVTLGPRGRNVIIQKSFGSPLVTKDGVTVAKEVDLEDVYENMGAKMVREVASKTNDIAGDGTTTATLMAEAIFNEGLRAVVSGVALFGDIANVAAYSAQAEQTAFRRKRLKKFVERDVEFFHKIRAPERVEIAATIIVHQPRLRAAAHA